MKIALDTNAVINICKVNSNVEQILNYMQSNPTFKLFINKRVVEEFNKHNSQNELKNLNVLLDKVNLNSKQYFTIGVSMIDGPDTIPPESYDFFNKDFSEQKYVESGTSKTKTEWVRKYQADPTIYSIANDYLCDFLVTDNRKDFQKAAKKFHTKIISIADFYKMLKLEYTNPNDKS